MDKNRSNLLNKLRMLDFAIQESALYLDGYGDNASALEYYDSMRRMREDVMAEYESKYGPITIFGNVNNKSWQWTDSPWPWESEAN